MLDEAGAVLHQALRNQAASAIGMLSINRVFPSRTAAKTREFVVASLLTAAKVSDSRISRYSTAKPACCNAAEPSAISRAMALGSRASAMEMVRNTGRDW